MSDTSSIYYLSQALELRDTPSELEKKLGIETTDRNWLRNLFLSNQEARQALDPSMSVDRLWLLVPDIPPVDLAGAFLVSGNRRHPAFLYTPASGLERFDTPGQAAALLLKRLGVAAQRDELLFFVALKIKSLIQQAQSPLLSSDPLQGAVLDDRRQSIERSLDHNLASLNDELLKLPSLTPLLGQLLRNQLGTQMSHVNLNALTVINHVPSSLHETGAPLPLNPVSTLLLSDALLEHYNRGGWVAGQSREFIAPGYASSAEDKLIWENAIEHASNDLNNHLSSTLQAFWNDAVDNGQTRREFFIEVLGTRFRAELLKQELDWNVITPQQFEWLCSLYPRDDSKLHQTVLHSLAVETSRGATVHPSALVMRNEHDTSFFLYCATRLRTFESEASLLDWAKTQLHSSDRDDELWHSLSLHERATLKSSQITRITLIPGPSSVFEKLFDDILVKQRDNVEYVLARYRASNGALALGAAFENALDIRALIDPGLLSLDDQGRWSHRLDLVVREAPAFPDLHQGLSPTLDTVKYQLRSLNELKSTLARGLKKRLTLSAFVQNELSWELNRAHLPLVSCANLYINRYASALPNLGDTPLTPESSLSVVEHFLERLAKRAQALAPATNLGLFSKTDEGSWARIASLDIAGLNRIIEKVLPDFHGHYLRQQRSVYGELSAPLDEAVTFGLRREAQLKALQGSLGKTDLEVLNCVLDSHQRNLRNGLRGFIPDAFALTLKTDATAVPIRLHNCFLLTERGGLSAEHSGATLLWTPFQGAETFPSFHDAKVELHRRLHSPVERLALLDNIARSERPSNLPAQNQNENHRPYPTVEFELIQSGFRGDRQHSLIDKALGDLSHALASPYSGKNLHRYLQSCLEAHSTIAPLERAILAAENAALHLALPPWLAGTTGRRQFALASLLDRYRQHAATTDDYHQGLPDIRDNARTKVMSLLSRDFPTARLDPDTISISLRLRNVTTLESLTDFALRHFDDIDSSSLMIRSLEGVLPSGLTVDRLKTLVKETAIGNHFAKILDSFLTGGKDAMTQRRPAFGRHFYWQGLMHAFTQVIGNTLSAVAHGFIKHLLAMPDGMAREPLNGRKIELRPLELISSANADASVDPVAGFYLIGPSPDEPGPQILFIPQGSSPVFKEYADQAAFILDLNTSSDLQQRVLERLAHHKRAHYAQQVFAAQRAIVAISNHPLRGNLLHRLYQDAVALPKGMLDQQGVQDQHLTWRNALSWLESGLYQGESYLLGRLRLPLVIWQTLPQLKDAADKLWQGRWSEAIEEFVVSLAQLAVARKGWGGPDIASLTPANTAQVVESPFPESPWQDSGLTPGQKRKILDHEAHEVSLQDMTLDQVTGLYRDATTQRVFVAVGGRVFQVQQDQRGWRIVKDQALGPWLKQDVDKRWSFDLKERCIEGPFQ
ncbi:hypothetical protein HX776_19285 [Pseudomonas agarici]|uniref:dermonecrotic toxin domain-containing protein n=1 Tax=Pseudomonas agarici TaxID=46677 RepID=UPI000474BFE0|nr:DUF6543 domain-containing protein [Pseudomonas agarici]NWC10948.1 hypothetical protein [Pseudomonas agarici]SEK89412.1 hypothetical protein SAMN05216604_10814 [Pseudomonas agarici]